MCHLSDHFIDWGVYQVAPSGHTRVAGKMKMPVG